MEKKNRYFSSELAHVFSHPVFWICVAISTYLLFHSGSIFDWMQGLQGAIVRGGEYRETYSVMSTFELATSNAAIFLWPFFIGLPYVFEYGIERMHGYDLHIGLRLARSGVYDATKLIVGAISSTVAAMLPMAIYAVCLSLRGDVGGRSAMFVQGAGTPIGNGSLFFLSRYGIFYAIITVGVVAGLMTVVGMLLAERLRYPLIAYAFAPVAINLWNVLSQALTYYTKGIPFYRWNVLSFYIGQTVSKIPVIGTVAILFLVVLVLYRGSNRAREIVRMSDRRKGYVPWAFLGFCVFCGFLFASQLIQMFVPPQALVKGVQNGWEVLLLIFHEGSFFKSFYLSAIAVVTVRLIRRSEENLYEIIRLGSKRRMAVRILGRAVTIVTAFTALYFLMTWAVVLVNFPLNDRWGGLSETLGRPPTVPITPLVGAGMAKFYFGLLAIAMATIALHYLLPKKNLGYLVLAAYLICENGASRVRIFSLITHRAIGGWYSSFNPRGALFLAGYAVLFAGIAYWCAKRYDLMSSEGVVS